MCFPAHPQVGSCSAAVGCPQVLCMHALLHVAGRGWWRIGACQIRSARSEAPDPRRQIRSARSEAPDPKRQIRDQARCVFCHLGSQRSTAGLLAQALSTAASLRRSRRRDSQPKRIACGLIPIGIAPLGIAQNAHPGTARRPPVKNADSYPSPPPSVVSAHWYSISDPKRSKSSKLQIRTDPPRPQLGVMPAHRLNEIATLSRRGAEMAACHVITWSRDGSMSRDHVSTCHVAACHVG